MPNYFKVILLLISGWAGLVSLVTGQIYFRSGPTKKGPMPRLFGLCLALVAATLALAWFGRVPAAYQAVPGVVVGSLLLLAYICLWFS